MSNEIYPLAIPEELYSEVRDLARATELSMADILRQSARLGLPLLKDKLCPATRLKLFRIRYWEKNTGIRTLGIESEPEPGSVLEEDPVLVVADNAEQALQLLSAKVAGQADWTFEPELLKGITAEGEARLLY